MSTSANTPSAPAKSVALTPSAEKRRDAEVKKYLGYGVKYLLPIAVSVILVVWLFHKVNFTRVIEIVRDGCDFRWILLMMLITTLSHIIRGIRWGIQLRAAGVPRMPVVAESVSIFGAYSLNLVFSELGEVWRCLYVSKREHCSLSTVVGTDIGDRISDLVVVILLLLLALVVAHPALMRFMDRYAVGEEVLDIFDNPILWCALALIASVGWGAFHLLRHRKFITDLEENLRRVYDGFAVIFHMKGTGLYILLTLGIWTCYFLETYVCFYAFPFTRALIEMPGSAWGLIPGLVVFVFGSISMAIPSNGGLGPWNLAVMFALSLYGITEAEGTAYSITVWSCQAVMLILLGLFSAAYISYSSRRPATPTPK